MPVILQITALMARFNNGLACPSRRNVYEALKKKQILGKVFSVSQRGLLLAYLFDRIDGKYWFEYKPYESCKLREVEEARVDGFFYAQLASRPGLEDEYGRVRARLERGFYQALVEIDLRADLIRKAGDELSLGLLPCSLPVLKKVLAALPRGSALLELLRGYSEVDFIGLKIRNPAARQLAGFVEKTLPKPPAPPRKESKKAMAYRLQPAMEF